MDPATYIVLLIMRSLDTTQIATSGFLPASLKEPLRPLLAKREIKARQIAAQAMANFLDIQSFADFARDLVVALQNQQYTSLNEVHGHILVIQGFLLSKPPNPDGLAGLGVLGPQFTQAATSQDWPSLVRDGLLDIAAVFGDRPVSVDPQAPSALAEFSDVDGSDSMRRLLNGHAITSAELMDVLPLLEKDSSTMHQRKLPERLYTTYANTSNSAQSRQAAVSALRPFAKEMMQSSNRQLFTIVDMLLNDDDTAVRKRAAEVVAQAFNNGESICQRQAEQLLWQQMIARFHDSADFASSLLAKLTDLVEIERLSAGLRDAKHDLFAEEPPNLFIEPYPVTQRLFDNFNALEDRAKADALRECQDSVSMCQSALGRLDDLENTHTLPLDPRRESLLLLRQRSRILSLIVCS
ncbi:hypothetical protein QFC22_004800 [Naganishia vaughanmartiniae]|uniref:Uncharacterized protein n=1 Tax=Naganishia vaughanmartiniae TaxID=1424756 RepID=A0ACC2WYW9_9TREE|nr:hypothetical protein QFC22_004800 [Naganishia vaughanmartiniae]